MNGPTRPGSFKGERPLSGARKSPAADIFDELDQFVDSEPVGWSERRPGRGDAAPFDEPDDLSEDTAADEAPFTDPEPRTGRPQGTADDRDSADAAFSSAPAASGRREAFQARLRAELSRPADEPAPEPPARNQTAWSTPLPARETVADAPDIWVAGEPDTADDDDADDDPVQSGVAEEPVDALEWELDNAIGAIIASSTNGSAPSEPDVAQRAPPVVPAPQSPARLAPPAPPLHDAEADFEARRPEPVAPDAGPEPAVSNVAPPGPKMEAPVRPVGGSRAKPIPTFRFDRRSDADENAVAAAPDLDNPLSSIFFQNYRADVPPDEGDVGSGDLLADLHADGLDDEFSDFDGDVDDRLPPSLSREADAGRRRRFGVAGIAAAVGALALLVGVVVIGLNLFGGDGSVTGGGEPPLIRADAVDVKVRPAEDNATLPEPDIAERAEIGDSDSLVIPDRVEITGFDDTAAPEPLDDEAADILSRRVRTVTVRPDGTIVPAGQADETADWAPQPSATTAAPSGARDDAVDVAAIERDAAGTAGFTDATVDAEEPFADEVLPAPETAGDTIGRVVPGAAIPTPRPTPPVRRRTNASATAGGPVDLASQRTATAPAPAAPVAADPSAPWGVQVSSQRSEADAQTSYRNLQRRYPSILGSVEPIIMAADLPGRGRFFRVRVAANSRGEAAALCQRLKSAGADCFIGRN